MKKIYLGFIALLCIVTSCKDVEYDEATYSEAVTDLTFINPEGTREVTLSWTNPTMAGQSGVQIIKNDKDVIDINEVVNSYYIKKVPVNEPVSYTVKAKYSDGRVSEGQTVRMNIAYEKKTGGNLIAMLVATDYTQSDDEKDAVAWFQKNYVNTGKGRLAEARENARISGITEKPLIGLGGNMYCLIPWLGTYAFLALERFIRIRCGKRLKLKGFDSVRPYYMQFTIGVSEKEFFEILEDEISKPLNPMELLFPKEVPVFERYDEMLPASLIRKGFAYGVLDIVGMKTRILQWSPSKETFMVRI